MPAPRYPAPTWPDATTPTVDQLKTWLRAHEPQHDARVAADMILGMLESEQSLRRNVTMRYKASQAALGDVMAENRRNRLAWLSARRGRLVGRQALAALAVKRAPKP